MKHRTIVLGLIAGLVAALGVTSLQADDKKAPDKVVTIDDCQAKKTPVKFDHAKHMKKFEGIEVKCETCHHTGDVTASCASCHKEKQGDKLGTCADMSTKKNPFHVACIDCHKKAKKELNLTAPTSCTGCHPKE